MGKTNEQRFAEQLYREQFGVEACLEPLPPNPMTISATRPIQIPNITKWNLEFVSDTSINITTIVPLVENTYELSKKFCRLSNGLSCNIPLLKEVIPEIEKLIEQIEATPEGTPHSGSLKKIVELAKDKANIDRTEKIMSKVVEEIKGIKAAPIKNVIGEFEAVLGTIQSLNIKSLEGIIDSSKGFCIEIKKLRALFDKLLAINTPKDLLASINVLQDLVNRFEANDKAVAGMNKGIKNPFKPLDLKTGGSLSHLSKGVAALDVLMDTINFFFAMQDYDTKEAYSLNKQKEITMNYFKSIVALISGILLIIIGALVAGWVAAIILEIVTIIAAFYEFITRNDMYGDIGWWVKEKYDEFNTEFNSFKQGFVISKSYSKGY